MTNAVEFLSHAQEVIDIRFHRRAQGHLLTHVEDHGKGGISKFEIKASCKLFAFSMDVPGLNPFDILNSTKPKGLTKRNDLTIICEKNDQIFVFVIEYKKGDNLSDAQQQIECGVAFCEYISKLIKYCYRIDIEPRIFGVAAYRPKSRLQKGGTTPGIKFVKQGLHGGIWRADWVPEDPLPLSVLVHAAEQCI